MRRGAAMVLVGIGLSACAPAPYPIYTYQAPVPLIASVEQLRECSVIRSELARQQHLAAYSGVMATPLVEASVRLNVQNVVDSLYTRAVLAGCPI